MEHEILEAEVPAIRFTSEVTHDLPTRKEVNKLYSLLHIGTILREGMVSAILLFLFGYLYCYSGNPAYYGRTIFVVALFYWGSFLFKLFRNRNGGESYRLMLRRNGGNPIHNLISFTEEGFKVENTYSEEVNEYGYARVRAIAPTQNFYLLYREMNQCTVVSKEPLTGGDEKAFWDFLLEQMPIAKVKTPAVGLTVRWIALALWVLSLGLAVYSQFF